MKRTLVLMLLSLAIAMLVSCNSYDIEGKPEIASNPAKKVFAFYPWDEEKSGGDSGDTTAPEPTDTGDTQDDTGDTAADTGDTAADTGDTSTDTGDTAADTGDTEADSGDTEEGVIVVKAAAVPDVVTEEFDIYNRGVTGELKIRKINMIDPSGNLIDSLDNETYKNLFKIQIQKVTADGIATEGWTEKLLTFDNMAAEDGTKIASLCPLDLASEERKCKSGFDGAKYNSQFKIKINYDKAAATKIKNEGISEEYRTSGDFSIEICTNDPTKEKSDTCGDNSTSYRIQITRQPAKPPKPIIHVGFEYPIAKPMSYRNIYDPVQMNLKDTCVSDPNAPTQCLDGWKSRYYIRYKWEMKESPTPLMPQSQLTLTDATSASAGQWLPDDDKNDNPKRASFTGVMITPRRYDTPNETYDASKCSSECGEEPTCNEDTDKYCFRKISDYLGCRQKYCERNRTKYYKINIQAETVDKETDLVSDTEDITVIPKIIPQARVVAQLTWKQGFRSKAESDTKEGVAIDLDIHMIKRDSLEAGSLGFTPTTGLLGTYKKDSLAEAQCPTATAEPGCEKFYRHDDCSFGDPGVVTSGMTQDATIQWHASLDIDNIWGGNNYETPETIGLGPITDLDNNGVPDVNPIDDQYLIVVGYVGCTSKFSDGVNRCDETYVGDDSAYEVDARVEILLDGDEAPRTNQNFDNDKYADTTKNFKIKFNEWKVLSVVKWDSQLPSPETNTLYPGNAIVSDEAMTITSGNAEAISVNPKSYPKCYFDNSDAVLVPIWDADEYKHFVETPAGESTAPIALRPCE